MEASIIQQAFRIVDGAGVDVDVSPLTVHRDPSNKDLILAGVWPSGSLESVRGQMAEVLGKFPVDVTVCDLLTGIRESARECCDRLAQKPSVASCFRFETAEYQGLRFLRLVGLAQFGEPDLLVEYEEDIEPEWIQELMGRLGDYRLNSGRPLEPGEPIPYGYWLLSVASERIYPEFPTRPHADELADGYEAALTAGLRIQPAHFIIEAKDAKRIGEDDWVVGASQAVRVLETQRKSNRRVADMCDADIVGCEPVFAQSPIMLCSRVVSSEEFFGHRMALGPGGESGWQFGCHQPDHLHDQTTMVFGTLSQVAIRDPRLLQYLGLPVGWSVSREADGFWINPPDEERSFRDEGSADHEPWCRVRDHE